MNQLFNYLWEASLALALLYGFYRLFLAKLTFFSWNRTYLLSSVIFALILPFLSFKISSSEQLVPGIFSYNLPEFQFGENESQGSTWTVLGILFWVYVTGVAWKIGMLLFGLGLTAKRIIQSEKHHKDGFCIVVNPELQPSSFLHYIFLPYYDENDLDQKPIVHHESVHVKKGHTLDLLLLHLCNAILWFHPVWIFLEASLREVHEYEADQEVTSTYPKTDYAKLLLGLLITESNNELVNNFNHFQTKKRIQMMMKSNKSGGMQKSVFLLLIPFIALMLGVFACDSGTTEDFPETLDIPMETQIATADEIFDVVEDSPEFKGGMPEWSKFLSSTLHYPDQAKRMGIEGTVYVVFEIQKDGRVTNPVILRGIGGGCDEEALRVIRQSPDWIPGKQRGREVAVRMRLPIRFKLSE